MQHKGIFLSLGFGLALVLAFSAPAQASAGADGLQQFTSGGQVLGFDDGGYFTSNGSYALRVRFEGATPASPVADGPVADGPVPVSPVAAPAGTSETAAPALERVSYRGVWPGVDVQYDAPAGALARSTWTVAAGADVGAIRLRYNRPVELTEGGELRIGFETGTLTESAPIAWQDVDGVRRPVEVAFAGLESDLVGFAVGDYRADLPLVIDPTLEWNTFLGGTGGQTFGYAIAMDASGNVYVGGESQATWESPVQAHSAGLDAFAAKLDASGALVWNTFLGGGGDDIAWGIAVDASGNVYVAGSSDATWGSPLRPFTPAVLPPPGDTSRDAFAAKLDASGALVWNTFLGGSEPDDGFGIDVDASGNVYVVGGSLVDFSAWGSPVLLPSSGWAAFVAKLDASGALVWNTFMGAPPYWTGPSGIAVDASGNVYVVGDSYGTWGSPVRPHSANRNAFVAKLDAASGALVWHTFLGGSWTSETGQNIAVDASGNVYVVGISIHYGWPGYPTWGSPVQAHSGGYSMTDAFAVKLDASGALVWNTFLGGSDIDWGWAVAVDASGNAYVAGSSLLQSWGSPLQQFTSGGDAFAAKLDTLSGALVWNTFLGGIGLDHGFGIAVDASGNVCVGGSSGDTWGSPLRPHSGDYDAFATCFWPYCGDGVQNGNEDCDGADLGICLVGPCQADCTCPDSLCGNGVLDAGECCDDGNVVAGDGCSADCGCEANHLQCYKMKDGQKFKAIVDLDSPQFGLADGCKVKGKARYFCIPAVKTVRQINGQTPSLLPVTGGELDRDYFCYMTKCKVQPPTVQIAADQFAERNIGLIKTSMMCVPAIKTTPCGNSAPMCYGVCTDLAQECMVGATGGCGCQ